MSLTQYLKTNFQINFTDLYDQKGLIEIDKKFLEFLNSQNSALSQKFLKLKNNQKNFSDIEKPNLLIDVAIILENFLAKLFGVEKENSQLKKQHQNLTIIYKIRREFVQREVAKKHSFCPENIDGEAILKKLEINYLDLDDLEKKLAEKIDEKSHLEDLTNYSLWAIYNQNGKKFHKNGALFILPQKIDRQDLINKTHHQSKRQGFDLTDSGFGLNRVLAETNYCIFCHKQQKDSCRTGIFDQATNLNKKDELGVELHGCPLDEKISEMNLLKSNGFSIAALSIAVIDNIMIAATGHRICNDCSKSCIYQKQDAVDIPQIETRILKDVLNLPYGFEIYSLLTRWNPLNLENNLPKENSHKKILIVGLGPAGFTLAHYLLNSGHQVVAIDGLKIEPLDKDISGVDEEKNFCDFKPIKFLDEIYQPLSSRLIEGFGGVVEYGITSRFDKNFLKIIRLLLERRRNFTMFGGLRFGSSITDEIAFQNYGFDHIALCLGAGRPNIINLKNNFAKGVRQASDFLMSLQLTGSYKENLFTNLQIRMPIVVIGGGLTAVDTACEAKAYYVVEVKKFAKKVAQIGKEKLFSVLNSQEKIIAEEFLNHAEQLENQDADELMKKLGGVKILYRKKIQDSPAYKSNHQELNKAFEEGIEFIENITPLEVEIDEFNHIKSLKCSDNKKFECRSLLIAAGTSPNISPAIEDNLDFTIEGKYFSQLLNSVTNFDSKFGSKNFNFITKIDQKSKKSVSFFGDLHPNFEGSVVKAMASAKHGYKQINEILKLAEQSKNDNFLDKIKSDFIVKIDKIEKLSDHVYQVFIKAPILANQTEIGHIFRLQNYHIFAKKNQFNELMAMEGVALTAIEIDREKGVISSIAVDYGGSTSLIKNFKQSEICIFMGPSGKPTEITKNETILLIGGGRGNQPLTSIAKAFKDNGCKVIFFAGYRKNSYIVNQNLMEKNSNIVVFTIEDEEPNLVFNNPQNQSFKGSVIEGLKNYFAKNSPQIDRIFTIGNNQMMHQIAELRHQNLVKSISEAKIAITSLNAPMQCMMKGICSQCLQKRFSEKGEEEYFYSCTAQDQDMDKFDFSHLHNRVEQNSLMEKLVNFCHSK
jgi:NADPH-dependent glutamate synthase beta subunit-like oxidoreductase/NAD(P)H-flavin reductase